MKIKPGILDHFHLDKTYSLMSGVQVRLLYEVFQILDIHENGDLNDIQVFQFMRHVTDLSKPQIYKVFDMLDVNGSGSIDFDEFYFLICILISIKDDEVKHFIFQHSRAVFDLLDADGSKSISVKEFRRYGFLFNYTGKAVKKIFEEFDISGDEEMDFREFRLFTMACIDAQREMEKKSQIKMEKKKRLQQLSFAQRIRAMIFFWMEGEFSSVVEPAEDVAVEETTDVSTEDAKPAARPHPSDKANVWAALTELYASDKMKAPRPLTHQNSFFQVGEAGLWNRCTLM